MFFSKYQAEEEYGEKGNAFVSQTVCFSALKSGSHDTCLMATRSPCKEMVELTKAHVVAKRNKATLFGLSRWWS